MSSLETFELLVEPVLDDRYYADLSPHQDPEEQGEQSVEAELTPMAVPADTDQPQMSAEASQRVAEAYVTHSDSLYGYALRLCRNQDTAQDLVQEGFARAVASIGTIDPNGSIYGWLRSTVRNAYFDTARRQQRIAILPHDTTAPEGTDMEVALHRTVPPQATSAEEWCMHRLTTAAIKDVIQNTMKPEYAETLLAVLAGHKYEEISDATGVPVGTVKSRVHRARGLVMDALKKSDTIELPLEHR